MKARLTVSLFLIAGVITAFIFRESTPLGKSEAASYTLPLWTGNLTTPFLIGVIQSYGDLTNYDAAGGLNITHAYGDTYWDSQLNRHAPNTWITNREDLTDSVPTALIGNKLQDLYNNHNHSMFLWQRPKIEWLAFGKSSIYKAYQLDDDYWFYAFNVRNGDEQIDPLAGQNVHVLHCGLPTLQMGVPTPVLSRLKANTEQSVRIVAGDAINHWQGSSEDYWLVKPRIRIDSNVAHNQQNVAVCEIKVFADDTLGHPLLKKDVIIHAINFLDNDGYYNGRYIEEYFNHPGNNIDLSFHGDLGNWFGYGARGNASNDNGCSKADIQVIWSGNCDMWIDYVKVQSNVADELFKGQHDDWIQDEVDAVMYSGYSDAVYNFYIEIPNFNNIPCIGYVNKKIQEYSGGKLGLMAEMVSNFNYQLSWEQRGSIVSPQQMKKMFTDSSNSNCVFLGDPYPIAADEPENCNGGAPYQYNKVPSTLVNTTTSGDMFDTTSPANFLTVVSGIFPTQSAESGFTNHQFPSLCLFL